MFLWLKALHLIAMVAWFAGLFYLWRLLVYQAENRDRPEVAAQLAMMAERLERIITLPAMLGTLVFGPALLWVSPVWFTLPWWMITKLVLVLGLAGYTVYVGRARRRFALGDYYLTPRQCRVLNEVPTLFLIAIILLAVLRPGG